MGTAMTTDIGPTPPARRGRPSLGTRSRRAVSTASRSRVTRRTAEPGGIAIQAPAPSIGPQILERAARVIRVLGHPLRLRLLETLEAGEVNVTDLVHASGATQALVSQHLGILRAEGVVGTRRDGGRIFYRITEPKVHRILDCIRDCDMPEVRTWGARELFELTGDD